MKIRNEEKGPPAETDSSLSSPLKRQYEMVGTALLAWEVSMAGWRPANEEKAEKDFKAGVSFVQVEVLESFLEDLLDVKVSDRSLFIVREHSRGVLTALTLGIMAALGAGYQASLAGINSAFSFLLSASLGITVVLLWQKFFSSSHRRLAMANLLSREISRRRGIPGNGAAVSGGIRSVISGPKTGALPEGSCRVGNY